MEVRSLGYRTDLTILALEGSRVTDRGDHLVIRTPGQPDYWWGNFLLLRDLTPGSGGGWMARFAAEFPDARHIALGLDVTDARMVDSGEIAGMTMERNAVMTATSVHAPLVWHAGATVLADGTSTLVMVADPEDGAIRVYRSVGFTLTEPQLGLICEPAG